MCSANLRGPDDGIFDIHGFATAPWAGPTHDTAHRESQIGEGTHMAWRRVTSGGAEAAMTRARSGHTELKIPSTCKLRRAPGAACPTSTSCRQHPPQDEDVEEVRRPRAGAASQLELLAYPGGVRNALAIFWFVATLLSSPTVYAVGAAAYT